MKFVRDWWPTILMVAFISGGFGWVGMDIYDKFRQHDHDIIEAPEVDLSHPPLSTVPDRDP